MARRSLLLTGAAAFTAPAMAQPAAQKPGGVLRVAAPTNPSTLDPMTGRSGADHALLFTVYDTLVEWEYDTLKAKPGLAKSWHSPDPQTLVLALEDGVTFHDGAPFDAAKAAAALGAGLDRAPVGSGPWKFVSWSDGNSMVVTRNAGYWRRGLPYLDGIEFRFIPDTNTGLRSVISGENDLAYQMSARQRPVINRERSLQAVQSPTVAVEMFYFNIGRPPVDDVRVRRAINQAIDRTALNQVTQLGMPHPVVTVRAPGLWS